MEPRPLDSHDAAANIVALSRDQTGSAWSPQLAEVSA
jgi:hypothetical protein